MSKPKHGLIDRMGQPIGQVLKWLNVPQHVTTKIFLLLFRFTRSMTMGVRVAAFNEDGQLFLVKHTYVDGWHFLGGGIEIGETAVDCLKKELMEEGNLEVKNEPKLHSIHLNARLSKRDHVLFYSCIVTQIEPKIPDHEISQSGFFNIDDLPEGIVPSVSERLAELEGRQSPSTVWTSGAG